MTLCRNRFHLCFNYYQKEVNFTYFCFLQLLVEHADEIAPDASDPLHDVLEELGDVPDVNTLMGKN